ncbi:MAG: Fic family protein [Gemmatimonadetes bacterium]|nr:Fic family protein [Gemmatimonadota bacterium]MYA43712.1 Fic family protein [Gemmatimonadota bacterium]MYE94147.1 Fic family protein [Gemmatimonadota bacterium]MYJ09675.1 Fic family protein [Gemmatimonadota bacterium]
MPGHHIRLTWRHDPILYAPPKYRRACAYDAFLPDPLADVRVALDGATAGVVSDAEGAIRALNSDRSDVLAPLARLLLRTESISSSRVEGIAVGARAMARAASRAESGLRVGATALEVLDNVNAMRAAMDAASAQSRFTTADIVGIHRLVMAHATNRHVAGQVRTIQNWIGGNDYNPCGADFVPPPPEHVHPLLEDLTDAVNREDLPPLVQAALVHAQFESIHPFEDGNGRTGRALVQVVLRRRGIAPHYVPPISVILAADRDAYIAGLGRFRFGDSVRWVAEFAEAAARAAALASRYLGAVRDLQDQSRRQLAAGPNPRADAAAWAVIDALPAHPVMSAADAIADTGRAPSAVHAAVQQLVDAGVLIPLSKSKRNRLWEAAGLLELVEGLEAGRPPSQADIVSTS